MLWAVLSYHGPFLVNLISHHIRATRQWSKSNRRFHTGLWSVHEYPNFHNGPWMFEWNKLAYLVVEASQKRSILGDHRPHVYGKQGTKPPTNCWSISLGGGSIPIENQIALGKAGVFHHTNHHRPFGLAEDAEHHGLDAVVVEGHRLLPYLWSDSIRTHRIGCQAAQSAPCGTLWN